MATSNPLILRSIRILEIGRDPLFKTAFPDQTDWVKTGKCVEPINRFLPSASEPTPAPRALLRLRTGYYDVAMFPAIRARTPTDSAWARSAARRVVAMLGRYPFIARFPGVVGGLPNIRYFVRDISDYPDIGSSEAVLFPDSILYAKREVLESDLDRPAGDNGGGIVTYLPMPFEVTRYRQWMAKEPQKTVDVFFAGKLHSHQRLVAQEAAEQLSRNGLTVDLPQERLSYVDYLKRLSRAWLVLSPKGHGEHCYRHYESLLMGSVPVINVPERPVHYSLQHGATALFHQPSVEDLVSLCRGALADKARLRSIAAAGRALVEEEHDTYAICQRLVTRVLAASTR